MLGTAIYLAISLVGVIFSWSFFREFGVNYFLFADLTDFLLAAFREPMALVAGASGVAVVLLLYRYAAWEVAKLQQRPRGRFLTAYARMNAALLQVRWMPLPLILFYIFLFVAFYSDYRVGELRDGFGVAVTPVIAGEPVTTVGAGLVLMGSSARFVFLYEPGAARTIIVPNEQVVLTVIASPRR